jgi:hypothetical protein
MVAHATVALVDPAHPLSERYERIRRDGVGNHRSDLGRPFSDEAD